jgi:hypothetical protein
MQPDDNLFDWAQKTLSTVLQGSFRERYDDRLADNNKKLRNQLKRAREISASRYKRLQAVTEKLTDKPEPKPKMPYLVAAE